MRIVLIRHGQTEWNAVDRIRGQVDVALDEVGLAQAEATARRVARDWSPGALFSSPLSRAVQTAAPLAGLLGLMVERVEAFTDMSFGEWQGLTGEEVMARWPEMARQWLASPHTVSFPGGESLSMVRARVASALATLAGQHQGQTIAIVGHTVVNRVMLCYALGIDDSNYWRLGQHTCAVNVLDWKDGVFYIELLNDTSHLRKAQVE
jgi:broad specificity phosphatase PhoE